jgi:hypothetical protein
MDNSDTTNINDNFYMLLPSNGCPHTQPDNNASSYIIDWETPISLKGKWEVGLTEFSIVNIPKITDEKVSIEYSIIQKVREVVFITVTDQTITQSTLTTKNIAVSVLPDGHVRFDSQKAPFTLIFDSLTDAKNLGFLDTVIKSTTKNIITQYKADIAKLYNGLIQFLPREVAMRNQPIRFFFEVEFTDLERNDGDIIFKEPLTFPSTELLCAFFRNHCRKIFEEFGVDQNGLIEFRLKQNINLIKFSSPLKRLLGLDRSIFSNQRGTVYSAESKPSIQKAFNLMFIYSSLIEPIMVGGVFVPLLRSIWLESTYNYGDIVHKDLKNKMYLPISSTSINNIEIEVRNDAGELIPFPYGSKTNLTLHFRRIDG